MQFTEIGPRLRAYRFESGLRAEEVAARLGVSRAALYRYEQGGVIKLDTLQRLAELLRVSLLSLLGMGVEYYSRPVGYFERVRRIEETADQILQATGPVCALTTSDAFDACLAEAYDEVAEQAGAERETVREAAERVLGLLAARKRLYRSRKPDITALLPAPAIRRFLERGVAGSLPLSERLRRRCQQVAADEIAHIASLMRSEPMGLRFGLLPGGEPNGSFEVLRSREGATLALNPFRPDGPPRATTGVALITAADEAVASHRRLAEALWHEAVKGPAAAGALRDLLGLGAAA